MIQANELRLSNIFQFDYSDHRDYIRLHGIYEKDGNGFAVTYGRNIPLDKLIPVELSPELLEACGFEKDDQGFHNLGKVSINMPGINGYAKGRLYFNSWFIKEPPKYLHELQNVVHALTGSELSINLEKVRV